MKIIFTFLLIIQVAFSNEHRILVTGFTKHEISQQSNGDPLNEENYGGGYEYSTFKDYNQLYYTSNATILDDSFNYLQYTLSMAPSIRYQWSENISASVGMAFFLMLKKETYIKHEFGADLNYGLIPGAAPIATLYYKRFTVNVAYVPTVSVGKINSIGFAIFFFGWTL